MKHVNLKGYMGKKVSKTKTLNIKTIQIPLTKKELRELLHNRLPCICCGREMLHPEDYRYLESVDLSKDALVTIALISPFEKYMYPVEKQVFAMLKDMALKYPDKNFKELLEIKKNIHELALVRIQSTIFNKINFYRRILPEKEAKYLRTLMIKTMDIVFDSDTQKPFSRRVFIIKLKKILKNYEDEKIKSEIIKIAKRLPRSSDEVSAFVMKNFRKPPDVIALNLIHPAVGTFEHLLPRSQKGMNNSLNFALECSYCNNSRHHFPLSVQLEENPQMLVYSQVHVDKLISLYKKGVGNKEYILNLKEVLFQLSYGEIDLDLSNLN